MIVNEMVVAYIVGLNLKTIDYYNTEELRGYVENILKIEKDYHKSIYIEEINFNYSDIKEFIEENTSLNFPDGKEIRYYNIPIIAKDIFEAIEKDISKQEILLIVDNKKDALELINIVKDTFKFISLIGIYGNEAKELSEELLEEYGISIFQPLNLKASLKDYDVIINNSEEKFDYLKEIRKRTIIFDFSKDKVFKDLEKGFVIHDIKLNIKGEYDIGNDHWVDNIISSNLYKGLFRTDLEEYYKISIGRKMKDYYVGEYIDENIKIKGIH